MPIGIDNIQMMSDRAIKNEREIIVSGGYQPEVRDEEPPGGDEDKEKAEPKERVKKWRVWDLEFEALMRMLDNAVSGLGNLYFSLFYNLLRDNQSLNL